jgi:NTP pyrophosphatase (non-canonical NTP hydrolase)
MKEFQKKIDDWFKKAGWSYWSPHEITAQIFEEGGEIARLINHLFGPKKKKSNEAHQELEGEVGDLLYAIICLANSQGIDLDAAMEKSIHKTMTRDKDRFPPKP